MSQQERRRNPYPWTWEPAAALTAVVAMAGLAGLQIGRTLANGLSTGHWQLAPTATWVTSAVAVVRGDAVAGLDPRPPAAAPRVALWAVIGLTEMVVLALAALALRWAWRRWNPWRPQGFANPAQVNHVLGLHRLRSTAHLIRPDLHHPPRQRRRSTR